MIAWTETQDRYGVADRSHSFVIELPRTNVMERRFVRVEGGKMYVGRLANA